jgi:hypothetical protein
MYVQYGFLYLILTMHKLTVDGKSLFLVRNVHHGVMDIEAT